MYEQKDKVVSMRVNSNKYNIIMAYVEQNKYKTYPALSFAKIIDEAMDAYIKAHNITACPTKPIKGQLKF